MIQGGLAQVFLFVEVSGPIQIALGRQQHGLRLSQLRLAGRDLLGGSPLVHLHQNLTGLHTVTRFHHQRGDSTLHLTGHPRFPQGLDRGIRHVRAL